MNPREDEFRDSSNFNSQSIRNVYRSHGRFPYPYESRRASNQYSGRFCQSATYQPRGPPGPLKRLVIGPSNVSTHSTVRWLNNNISSVAFVAKTHVPSRPRILTPVSSSSAVINTKPESKSAPSQSLGYDTVDGNVDDLRPPGLEPSTSNEVDKFDLKDLSSLLGLRSDRAHVTNKPKLIEETRTIPIDITNSSKLVEQTSTLSTSADSELNSSSVQIDEMNQCEETTPMDSSETAQATSWSTILEELKSYGNMNRKRNPRKQRRYRSRGKRPFRNLQRSMSKVSINDIPRPASANNIYTKYALSRQFRNPWRSDFTTTETAPSSYSNDYRILPLLQRSYASRLGQWNSSSGPRPNILTPDRSNLCFGSYTRPPWHQQNSGSGSNLWNRSTVDENRYQVGQKFGSNVDNVPN